MASAVQNIGWNPKPPLWVAAVPALFSECTSTSDASMSNQTGPVPVVAAARAHTRARSPPIASHKALSVSGPIWRNTRYSVESDGTWPNKAGWARSASMSLHASPPPASISIACTSTLPRS